MSQEYIKNHFLNIKQYASIIENRGEDEEYQVEIDLSQERIKQ